MINPRKYKVTVTILMRLPFRKKNEEVDKVYTVWAKTKAGALKAVKASGGGGRVVDVVVSK